MTTPTPAHTPRKTLYETLCDKYGSSAATTYTWQREAHHTPADAAFIIMLTQLENLGPSYPGGISCAPYRKA